MVRALAAIAFTTTVSPIPLSSTFIRDGMNAQISGWGATEKDKGPDSNNLKIANVVTGTCKDTEFMTFTPQHICAGSASNTTLAGICTTDVGGPLVLYGQLIGIGVHFYYNGCGMYYVRVLTTINLVLNVLILILLFFRMDTVEFQPTTYGSTNTFKI